MLDGVIRAAGDRVAEGVYHLCLHAAKAGSHRIGVSDLISGTVRRVHAGRAVEAESARTDEVILQIGVAADDIGRVCRYDVAGDVLEQVVSAAAAAGNADIR